MLSYFVYIVECSDKSYYTGVTNNLEKRLGEHNSGYSITSYTFKRRPVVLKFSQQFHDVHQAIALEKQIKGWSRRKKEAFINEEWEKLRLLSKNYRQFKRDN
ncbi:MAG: GIY-YIG nuclease family protein [Ferruginibacter sp.]